MDDSLNVWPYHNIITQTKVDNEIIKLVGPLNNHDLLYYASYVSFLTKEQLTDTTEVSLVDYLIKHILINPDLFIQVFTKTIAKLSEIDLKLEQNYDLLLCEYIDMFIKRIYQSKVFPIVSDSRTAYELGYYRLTHINNPQTSSGSNKYSSFDNKLHELLDAKSGFVDLDTLEIKTTLPVKTYSHKTFRIAGSNKVLYDNVMKIISKYRAQVGGKRKTIPKAKRTELWDKYFKDKRIGSCLVCNCQLDVVGTWEAGHVIAYSKGGSDDLENLRPVCQRCNRSMGTQNMGEWARINYPNNFVTKKEDKMCEPCNDAIITRTEQKTTYHKLDNPYIASHPGKIQHTLITKPSENVPGYYKYAIRLNLIKPDPIETKLESFNMDYTAKDINGAKEFVNLVNQSRYKGVWVVLYLAIRQDLDYKYEKLYKQQIMDIGRNVLKSDIENGKLEDKLIYLACIHFPEILRSLSKPYYIKTEQYHKAIATYSKGNRTKGFRQLDKIISRYKPIDDFLRI
jgi:HNH endonuclease